MSLFEASFFETYSCLKLQYTTCVMHVGHMLVQLLCSNLVLHITNEHIMALTNEELHESGFTISNFN